MPPKTGITLGFIRIGAQEGCAPSLCSTDHWDLGLTEGTELAMTYTTEYRSVDLLPLTFSPLNASEPAIHTSFVGVMLKSLASRLFI